MKKIMLLILKKLPPTLQGKLRVALYNALLIVGFDFSLRFFNIMRVGKKSWLLSKGEEKIYLAIPNRVGFYKNGIKQRLEVLQHAFSVEKINIKASDYVIDIGANIGEFSLPILQRGANVIMFEMDPNVQEALILNVGEFDNAVICDFGLWNETKRINMFVKSGSADTSLIDNGASEKYEIQCNRLDDVVELKDIAAIKLLKCDAEGAEPEVLQGAENILRKTNFVSVDCGPERGCNNERTVEDVKNLLIKLDFKILREKYGNREVLIAQNNKYTNE